MPSTNVAPVDPRVERSRRLICEAALEELGEVGYGAMTIESIARRAGVGKATVYRHWSGKLDLVESALDEIKQEMDVPEAGSARDRIVALLTTLATSLEGSRLSSCMPAIVSAAQYDRSVREFLDRYTAGRRAVLHELLAEGVGVGEFDVDVDLALHALVGPLFYRRLMTLEPFPPERVGDLVDFVVR